MKIDIICPLYNAEKYVLNLHKSLLMQKQVFINKIWYVLTESEDNTKKLLDRLNIKYELINKNDFSHSLTREKYAKKSNADIIVFITQDIVIEDDTWLQKLVKPIIDGKVEATYSRQISKYNNLEKYIREYNYPSTSKVMKKSDIKKFGLKTFFFSDVSSAIRKNTFKKLNYYDGKDLLISEDMYIAYKLIINGYKIKYCANSIVYHSHKYKLIELYKRYRLTGYFFKCNSYLDNYGTTSSGKNLALYVLKRVFQDKKYFLLIRYPFDMMVRFIGMKVGKR